LGDRTNNIHPFVKKSRDQVRKITYVPTGGKSPGRKLQFMGGGGPITKDYYKTLHSTTPPPQSTIEKREAPTATLTNVCGREGGLETGG